MRYSVRRDSIPKPGVLWRDTLLLLERLRPTQGTPVLCYHKISHDPQAARHPLALPVSAFAQQMGLLASWGYEVVRLSDALSARPVSGRRVAITFDDGHADALELAAPILQSYGFPATLFVVTDWVGRTGFLDHTTGDRLDRPAAEADLSTRFLTWSELRELMYLGWEIGSHTCSHPRLSDLPEAERLRELTRSREILSEMLGDAVRPFAYPYRSYDPVTMRLVGDAGYRFACSPAPGVNRAGTPPLAIQRAALRGWHDRRDFELRLTDKYPLFRKLAALAERRAACRVPRSDEVGRPALSPHGTWHAAHGTGAKRSCGSSGSGRNIWTPPRIRPPPWRCFGASSARGTRHAC